MSKPLMRYQPPRPRTARALRLPGGDDAGITENMRLFLAFQVAMQNLSAIMEIVTLMPDGRYLVALDPRAYHAMRRFIEECATGQEL